MHFRPTVTFLTLILSCATAGAQPKVKLGIDRLIELDFAVLSGQRVGLVTNPTGVTSDLRSTVDVLANAPSVKLVALFGPEHGVRGSVPAGDKIKDYIDPATGLPVRSLYGSTRKPTPEMLAEIDTLVIDIQDIGSRSYTYISTMAAAMEAAAEHGKRVVILDRPNPLGGHRVEGRVLDMEFQSFVGYMPIPYLHGMTMGELAGMLVGEGWLGDLSKLDLTVIPMQGWKREMLWQDTGLVWIPTSPHVPRADAPLFYAATGIMGELHIISEGVGYPLPFELAGAPFIEPEKLAAELNARKLPGVHFRPTYFQPYYLYHSGQTLGGVQLLLTDPRNVALTPIQFHIMDAVTKLYPETELFGRDRDNMFDKVTGTNQIREMMSAGKSLEQVLSVWGAGVDQFREQRRAYLLYR
jgi:uncharacterized protein YbbC (DUF1343 family)